MLSTGYPRGVNAARITRYARRRAGMTQRALAHAAGVPQSTVARIETGKLAPRVDTLDRILRAAGHGLTVEPRPGIGVDRSQMRELLRLTPGQRARLAIADAVTHAQMEGRLRPR